MNKEQALELMTAIDPALVEQADIQLPAKRRMPKIARVGLIAACLCLALVGTAAAAVANGWITVTDIKYYLNTNVNGKVTSYAEVKYAFDGTGYIPLEQFSQEAREVPRSSTYLPQYRSFDSWDEAEEFLGIEIANNPMLDQMEPLPWSLEDSQYGIKMDEANCFVTFFGLMDAPAIILNMIYDFETDGGGDCRLYSSAYIRTQPLEGEAHGAQPFHNTTTPITETYVTPSGLQAAIAYAYFLDSDDSIICHVDFQMHGANFTLDAYQFRDTDQLIPMIKEILDAYS